MTSLPTNISVGLKSLDSTASIAVAMFAIVGGLATVLGPAVGAIIFIPIDIMLRAKLGTALPGIHMIIYGIILIVVLLYMPKGIYGTIKEKFSRSG